MKLTSSHLFKAGARLYRTGGCTLREVRDWSKNLTAAQREFVLAGYKAEKSIARLGLGNRAGRPLGKV